MRDLKREFWPHKVKVGEDQFSNSITEIELWLGKQLGTFKGRWNVVYHYDKTYFYFREQQDAVLFALKWS
jgi:hypothetical protein